MTDWATALDELERELDELERGVRHADSALSITSFVPPDVGGPLPMVLQDRARRLHARVEAITLTVQATLAHHRLTSPDRRGEMARFFDRLA